MKIKFFSLFFLLFSGFLFAQNKSSIDFVIKNLGINVDGYFNTFTTTTDVNSNGDLQKLEGKIKVASIRTGIESRDEHLLEEEYFNVKKHEYITLVSNKINKKSNGTYTVEAILKIKGKTKKITIPVTVEKQSNGFKIKSEFEINRKDFDVGGSSFVMSKTVMVSVIHYQQF